MKYILPLLLIICGCKATQKLPADAAAYHEAHRPQIHFSPRSGWMNDPNGMLFHNGTYHLFYQHYPDSTVWGPMHWGHATSTDLVHWQQQPIALYPDSLGYIFSGSAVADINNTSGFAKEGKVPLVAIFTHHDTTGERRGRNDYQVQSLAYSLDDGKTWTKYSGNPVLKNPGIKDFRDPKVRWHEASKNWIMSLATLDRITFYTSPDLKTWTKASDFGAGVGAHGGVWECPDLFPVNYNGETVWVLLVSINPGGPNGGSATQYFTGHFDGKTFTPVDTVTRWIDYGPDDYAGVSFSGVGNRALFMGWMSNWQYANVVPTGTWRSAMTVPRDLSIEKIGNQYFVRSMPAPELQQGHGFLKKFTNINGQDFLLPAQSGVQQGPAQIELYADAAQDFSFTLSNAAGEQVVMGYDKTANQYFIDRSKSGKIHFEKGFASRSTAPRISNNATLRMTLVIDDASVEMFADGGLTVMTAIFFPNTPYTQMRLQAPVPFAIRELNYISLNSIL